MGNAEHEVRQALWITAGGVIASGVVGSCLYLALPDAVQSTMAGAPSGQLQGKGAALGFLLWLVPATALFIMGVVVGCTALGPDYLNVHRSEAKKFWKHPENWPVARAFILHTVALLTSGMCLLIVLGTCLDAGEQAWSLPSTWWAFLAVPFIALLIWTVWRMFRLEDPESFNR